MSTPHAGRRERRRPKAVFVTAVGLVVAALAARQLSESVGRLICLWTNRLPEKFRDESDKFLATGTPRAFPRGSATP